MVNDQKINDLKERLSKKDTSVLLQTIKEVKMEGNYSLIPYLISILKDTKNQEVQDRIIDILNNLNMQASVPYLTEAIQNTEEDEMLDILIASCWKNRLDFSDYIEIFVDKFIQHGFDVALEAFTVLENSTTNSDKEKNDEMVSYLEKNMERVEKNKKLLMDELIQIFKSRNKI